MCTVKFSDRGMMLVTILMLTFLLVMLTTSMILFASQNLNIAGLAEKKTKAIQAAESGLEYAFYQLNNDSTWGTGTAPVISASIGTDQTFAITFNSSEPYHSKNNLMNKDPNGTTPGYSAEIICRGTYKSTEKIMRAIFVREDEFQYPLITEGQLAVVPFGLSSPVLITGKSSNPGRMHSNTNIRLCGSWFSDAIEFNLNKGFVSTTGNVDTTKTSEAAYKIMRKENTNSLKIPDINIQNIINNRPSSCLNINNNTFYMAGFFEYDPNVPYCVPHAAPACLTWEPAVNSSSLKFGIASFTENSYDNFINNLASFYYNPVPNNITGFNPVYNPVSGVNLNTTRNLCSYYTVNFWEYDPNNPVFAPLDITVSTQPAGNPLDPGVTINLKLNKDLYIDDGITLGLYETYRIAYVRQTSDVLPNFFPEPMGAPDGGSYVPLPSTVPVIKLDLNNHNIYGSKLYLGIAPSGTGGIISKETIDFIHAYDPNMVVLSEKSVRIGYQPKSNSAVITYNGIIYAKDNVTIVESSSNAFAETVNFNGTIVSRNLHPSDWSITPMTSSQIPPDYDNSYKGSSLYIIAGNLSGLNIRHSDDGLEQLVSLRGSDFKVRKQLYEIIK